MKKIQLLLICLICVAKTHAQATNRYTYIIATIIKDKKSITAKVEPDTTSIGIDSSWLRRFERDLNHSIQYAKKIKRGKHIVSARFIMAKDGNLSDISCGHDPGYGLCWEVMRVLKKSKNWAPAQVASAVH